MKEQALQDITWRHLGLSSIPTPPRSDRSASAEYITYQRALKANTQAMVKLREHINHCNIWFLCTVSTRDVQNEFKQLYQEFVHNKVRENSDTKFTAQALVNHIIAHYLIDNIAQVKLLEPKIE